MPYPLVDEIANSNYPRSKDKLLKRLAVFIIVSLTKDKWGVAGAQPEQRPILLFPLKYVRMICKKYWLI